MKNVDELYEKYYNAYKSHYDNDDELMRLKRKILTTNRLNQVIEQMKKQKTQN